MQRDWSTLYHFCLQATISSCTMVQNHLINSLWLSLYFKESISTNGLIDINRLLLSSTCLLLPSIRPPSKSKSVDWMTKLLSQIPWINHFCENAKTNNGIQSTRTESNDNNNFFNWKKMENITLFYGSSSRYRLSFGEFVKYSIVRSTAQQTQNNKQNCQLKSGKKSVVCLFANEHNTHKFLFSLSFERISASHRVHSKHWKSIKN